MTTRAVLSCLITVMSALPATGPASASEVTDPPSPPLEITLAKDDGLTRGTRDQLLRLLDQHDLSKWLFTRKIHIESGVIPHSHPVLTLSTRYIQDDELLLATFVHEQLHWFLDDKHDAVRAAVADFGEMFPAVPVGYPDGARDEYSTYMHLIVCSLEHAGVEELLGQLRARWTMEFWATHHYRWIYRTILDHRREIDGVLREHSLIP